MVGIHSIILFMSLSPHVVAPPARRSSNVDSLWRFVALLQYYVLPSNSHVDRGCANVTCTLPHGIRHFSIIFHYEASAILARQTFICTVPRTLPRISRGVHLRDHAWIAELPLVSFSLVFI